MTALLLVACVGMITGAFFIFRISPMDFTLGVFRRLTTGPKSIRDDINETAQRKKPGFFRREILETQTILQATGKEQKFPALCAASLLLFAIGAGIAIVMNNFLLVPVLAAGMMFLPFWYIKLTAGHYKKDIAAELETALSIITTAYLRSEDLQTAVEENINYLNPPVHGVFRSFLLRIKHIDPNMDTALTELKTAIDNVNTNITAGYTAVKSSIDDMTGQLTVKLSDNTTAIVNMENGLKNQLIALKQMIEQQGGKIVTAIGKNGDVIVAAVNAQGGIIGTAITTQGGEIKGSITGLENGIKNAITQQTTDMNLKIAGVVDAITAQTAALNTAIAKGASKVVKSNTKLQTALTTAINELKDKQDANSQAMLKQLEKMAADNGIYQDPADKTSVYMEPSMWAAVNANPELKKIISDMLEVQKPTILCNAYYSAYTGTVQNNNLIKVNTEQVVSTTEVVAGTLQPMQLANGKKVIRIAKVPEQMNYNITSTVKNILHILYVDAKGKNSLSYGGVSNTLLNLTTYKDGVIMSVLKCNFYLQNDADATGTPSFEYPE